MFCVRLYSLIFQKDWFYARNVVNGYARSILRQLIVKSSSHFEFSLHPQSINSLAVDCQIFLLFRIFLVPTIDQSFYNWLSNLPLISNFLCTHARSILRQLILKYSSYFEFSLHPRSINPSTVDCQIFLLFRIFLAPMLDQSFDILLSNIPLILDFPCTHVQSILFNSWLSNLPLI